jgi:pimeloyl-ACP methyl ester carboxylesterase
MVNRLRGASAGMVGAALAAALFPAVLLPAAATPALAESRAPNVASRPLNTAKPNDTAPAPAADIVSAPTLIARTADGDVGYRDVGQGSPILLITGSGASMDLWDPSFVNALAASHRVIVFDNAGVGDTSALPAPLTITAMAKQASALITALGLRHPTVLGWSMGGMIAQALTVLRPWQVGRLILAASQPGNGKGLPIPAATLAEQGSTNLATIIGLLFPADQEAAGLAYFEDIFQYPNFYAPPAAVSSEELTATLNWIAGDERAGHLISRIHVPTLVADGTEDAFDPVGNAAILAGGIRHAQVVLFPDAGHAFLFQDASQTVPLIDQFIDTTR